MLQWISIVAIWLMLSSCGGSDEKPELIEKTRPILVELNPGNAPQAAVFGQEVTLVFHFISPDLNSSLTAESAEPLAGPTALPALSVEAPAAPTDYPGLRHFQVTAKVTVPMLPLTEPVKMRYALIAQEGGRSMRVEGDFPAYPTADHEGVSWSLANSEIVTPSEGTVPSKVDLTASIENTQNEGVKLAWFVSGGELTNRRDSSSEWKLPGPGTYTVVLTVRGQKSRTGALRFRTVTYQ
jgi:hypothetical protein